MEDDAIHRARIATYLRSIRRGSPIMWYEVLQGGISGAATYRVHLSNDQIVVKIAAATSALHVLERARREALFYRDLADRIPLRVPAVLNSVIDASEPCLCLESYQPVQPIETWPEQHYLEIAGQLGQFHATFWSSTHQLSHLPWLLKHGCSSDAATRQQAAESWRALARQPVYRGLLTADELAWIEALVRDVDLAESVLHSFPTTLCHGDCHHGNLLVDAERQWRWADWQEVGIGRGPEDLSFFFQRARMAGGTVPEDAAIGAYRQSLEAALGHRIAPATVKRVIDASELRSLLLLWPPFLSQASVRQLRGIVHRLHHVAEGLGLGS